MFMRGLVRRWARAAERGWKDGLAARAAGVTEEPKYLAFMDYLGEEHVRTAYRHAFVHALTWEEPALELPTRVWERCHAAATYDWVNS